MSFTHCDLLASHHLRSVFCPVLSCSALLVLVALITVANLNTTAISSRLLGATKGLPYCSNGLHQRQTIAMTKTKSPCTVPSMKPFKATMLPLTP
ncbi:hypothetical protein BDW71DRAFT_181925 [Aspergillus fruticulosus]